MNECIERKTLLEEIQSLSIYLGGNNIFDKAAKQSVLRIIDEQPSVDAIEVVRCKDCKHCDIYKMSGNVVVEKYICEFDISPCYDNFYCGYGEKRE